MRKFMFIVLVIFINPVVAQILCFTPATNFTTGTNPFSITSTDFNGDGKIDLAITNGGSNNISILLGTGGGAFSAPTNFSTGIGPSSIISGDFNGDSKIDLAVSNYSSQNMTILLGTGTGNFSSSNNFSVGVGPQTICRGDFNGDGKIDIAAANTNSHKLSILLGNGSGGFSTVTNFAVDSFPYTVICADVNMDGNADLITANYSTLGEISVLLGTGTGSFGTPTNFVCNTNQTTSVCSGDFNGDGKLDLAACSKYGTTSTFNTVSIFLGNGMGNFAAVNNFAAGIWAQSICTADFNGDSQVDLAVGNGNSDSVSILLGQGTGNFGSRINLKVNAGTVAAPAISADFNGDAKPDLAVSGYSANNVSILLNCSALFVNELNLPENTSIYPNPSSNSITIRSSTELGMITIYNAIGEIVLQTRSKNTQLQIDVSKFPAGVFTLFTQGKYIKLIKE